MDGETRRLGTLLALLALLALSSCARPVRGRVLPPPEVLARPRVPPEIRPLPEDGPRVREFTATAYCLKGRTASGTRAREGIVAADPDVLPLGSRIRVHEAGQYSGEYSVEDTGRLIDGRMIDIYIVNRAEAKRFGRRRVRVEVIHLGVAER